MNLTPKESELLEASMMEELGKLTPADIDRLTVIVNKYITDPQALAELVTELKGL